MGIEIERKFLVVGDGWKAKSVSAQDLRQGYLSAGEDAAVRIRIGRRAYIAVKGCGDGLSRPEFEYEVPAGDAEQMLKLCGTRTISKRRHLVVSHRKLWEVDVFEGRLAGLVMAEIELNSPGEEFETPEWLGEEVTSDPRYLNMTLACKGLPHHLVD